MEIIKENSRYKLIRGIGQYWNNRYELMRKDFYYENTGRDIIKVETLVLEYHSTNLDNVLNAWERRNNNVN